MAFVIEDLYERKHIYAMSGHLWVGKQFFFNFGQILAKMFLDITPEFCMHSFQNYVFILHLLPLPDSRNRYLFHTLFRQYCTLGFIDTLKCKCAQPATFHVLTKYVNFQIHSI